MAFASGVAVSAICSAAAFILIPTEPESVPIVLVYDQGLPLSEIKQMGDPGSTSAKLMRGCGVKEFSIVFPQATDSSILTEAPLSAANLPGLSCTLKQASMQGFEFSLKAENAK